jgi:hypothetical protein
LRFGTVVDEHGKTQRNIANARAGCATAARLAQKAQFDAHSRAEFEEKVKRLRDSLARLDQNV